MKDRIKQFLDQLNERERQMVYVAAVALALFLPYQILWAPFMSAIESLDEKVAKQEQDLLWMQDKIIEVQQLGSAVKSGVNNSKSLYGVIENTARQKFGSEIRVEQEGNKGIRVRINNTEFDQMIIWLDDLQYRHKVFVKEFKVDRGADVGRVTANILIEG